MMKLLLHLPIPFCLNAGQGGVHVCLVHGSSGGAHGDRGTYADGSPPGYDTTNIYNILTIIGHRFGYQSGIYESSG